MGNLKIDRVQLEIVIKNDDSRKRIRELEQDTTRLTREMKALERQGKKDTDVYREKEAAIKRNRAEMDRLIQAIGLTGLSMKELQQRQKELNAIMRNMDPRIPEYKKLEAQLLLVNNRMKELKTGAQTAGNSFQNLADGFNKYFGLITAATATLTGLIMGFRKVIDIANEFGASVANLSALTGLVGDDLQWLADQAKKVALEGTEAGVKVTAGAQAIVDAYTLMGSAKPELLKNKEALDLVTQSALTLAEASRMKATDAVESLALTMNQFSAPAKEAARYINVLAAGSKEGAAEVPQIAASMVKFGAASAAANISIEESVGLIETLAEKGLKGERAGTQIKTALLKMQIGADDTNPAIVGLQVALDNLRAKGLTAAEMVKFFGLESYVAAEILVANSPRVKFFTDAVTNTGIAMEQAAINTDTNSAALQRAKNRMEITAITLGEKLAPSLTFSTNAFNYLVKAILAAPAWFKKNEVSIILMTGAILAYNAAVVKSIAATILNTLTNSKSAIFRAAQSVQLTYLIAKEQMLTIWKANGTVATKLATSAQLLWNTAVAANPIGAVIVAITALVAAIKLYDRENSAAYAREWEKTKLLTRTDELTRELTTTTNLYAYGIQNLNKHSRIEKENLRDKIALSIDYAKAQLLELRAKEALLQKDNERATVWQTIWNSIISYGSGASFAIMQATDAIDNSIEAVAPIKDKIEEAESSLKRLYETSGELNDILYAENTGDAITSNSIGELEEKIRYYGIALRNTNKDTLDFARIQEKLSKANKELKITTDQLQAVGENEGAKKEAEDAERLYREKTEIRKRAISTRISLMEEGYNKEFEMLRSGFENEREALKHELETNKTLSVDARADLNSTLLSLDARYLADQEKLKSNYVLKDLQFDRLLLQLKLSAVKENSAEEFDLKRELLDKEMRIDIASVAGTEEQKQILITAIRDKYARLQEKLQNDNSRRFIDDQLKSDLITLNEAEQKKLQALKEKFDAGKLSRKEYNRELQLIQKQYTKDSLQLSLLKAERELDIIRAAGGEVIQAEEAIAAIRLKMQQVDTSKVNEGGTPEGEVTPKDLVNAAVDSAQSIADATFQIIKNNKQKELDLALSALDRQREAELSNKNLTEAQKEAILKKYKKKEDKLKTDAFKKQKNADIIQAVINGALGITKTFAAYGFTPAGWIAAIGQGIATAAQIAVIAAQPVPQFYKGKYPVIGAEDGRTYSASYTGPASTGLYSSPTLIAERGPEIVIDAPTTSRMRANAPELIRSIYQMAGKIPQRAAGKYPVQDFAPNGTDPRFVNSTDPALVKVINDLNSTLVKGIRSKLSLLELEDFQAKKESIEQSSSF
jgi:TP901 family phage tail tape measure protein